LQPDVSANAAVQATNHAPGNQQYVVLGQGQNDINMYYGAVNFRLRNVVVPLQQPEAIVVLGSAASATSVNPGITFDATPSPAPGTGKFTYGWVQVVNGTALDNWFTYDQGLNWTQTHAGDWPILLIPRGRTRATLNLSFTMYYMCRPNVANAIWVPLASATWHIDCTVSVTWRTPIPICTFVGQPVAQVDSNFAAALGQFPVWTTCDTNNMPLSWHFVHP
jgi:hypothetical protein